MAKVAPGQDTEIYELQGMQLISNAGEVTPWVDRREQVPPETVAIAVGALLEVSKSREWAYRIAYTLFDARLLPQQTPIGEAGMTLAEADLSLEGLAARDAARGELLRAWVDDGYELPTDLMSDGPEPDRWVPDDDGCAHPEWDMPTETVCAWTGGISTDIFGYREDLDDVERQARAMLAAVAHARRFVKPGP